jgi:two-component system, NarL family, sensor kinase
MFDSQEIRLMIITAALVFILITSVFVFIILFYQKKKFQHKEQMNVAQQQYTESLLQTRLEIQAQTFQNISQEIHDNIGQVLSLVKINMLSVDLNKAPQAQEKLQASVALVTKVIRDLRDLSKTLNPDFISNIGLPVAIGQQLEIMGKTGVYKTHLAVEGEVYKMEAAKELVVYRVIQELLNNIIKHAEASEVQITMLYYPDKLQLTVKDNGHGFDYENTIQTGKGQGLQNILKRIQLINGTTHCHSAMEQGATTSIEIAN